MRSRPLSFADALQLLGAGEDPAVARIGALAGIGAGVVTVGSLGTVDFFALRDEAVRWGNTVVGGLRERVRGYHRFDRTQRLVAAHSVIVVTAFFEAVDEMPELELEAARLSAPEQIAVTGGSRLARTYEDLVRILLERPPPMPAAHLSFEDTCHELESFYEAADSGLRDFLEGLAGLRRFRSTASAPQRVLEQAIRRYAEAYRLLAAQAPEFGVWAQMVDAQATRAAVRESAGVLTAQLAELRAGVARAADETTDAVRAGLRKRYEATLKRSILSSAEAPAHVVLPTLEQGYVGPRGLVAVAGRSDLPAAESWWEGRTEAPDVQALLLAHLTGAGATTGPLVVLGQPGSGKSVLTRILAASLPEPDFLVVRVELRNVHADASPQSQIESAIYQILGERVTWPELARKAAGALPVIIMDGFDELLQATGVNRADYLEQILQFQQREAELDRPVAVLVTSRTVVADRARFPAGTVVVRLEPFDAAQVRQWLDVWNGLNRAGLTARSLRPLPAEVALVHHELAAQPLLLLLLALYDAGANALQHGGDLGRVELYERLFQDFIQREVDKHVDGDRRTEAVEVEWRRLGAVALAMLNRGGDVIREPELDADVPHLLHPDDLLPAREDSMRRPLTVSQLLVGRFFFIHESKAARDTSAAERTFEFLHATFGEFLAARQIVGALVELAGERRSRRPGFVLDAGYLWAATSFVTVARRVPLFEFCQGLLARLPGEVRRRCRELVLELLPDAGYAHPSWSLAGYEPRRRPFAARHAAFSANLVCFAVMLSDGPVDVAELVGEPMVIRWKSLALLWHSQLEDTDRQRLWQSFRVAWRFDTAPATLEIRVEDDAPISVYESLPWPTDERPDNVDPPMFGVGPDVILDADSYVGSSLRRAAFTQTAFEIREFLYALMPVWTVETGFGYMLTGTSFELDTARILRTLFSDRNGQSSLERADDLAWTTGKLQSAPHLRQLAFQRIIDEFGVTDGDDFQCVLLSPSTDAQPDFLAELAAAIARRGPIDPGLQTMVTETLAAVGVELPNWLSEA